LIKCDLSALVPQKFKEKISNHSGKPTTSQLLLRVSNLASQDEHLSANCSFEKVPKCLLKSDLSALVPQKFKEKISNHSGKPNTFQLLLKVSNLALGT
jgi:hypothetical protein